MISVTCEQRRPATSASNRSLKDSSTTSTQASPARVLSLKRPWTINHCSRTNATGSPQYSVLPSTSSTVHSGNCQQRWKPTLDDVQIDWASSSSATRTTETSFHPRFSDALNKTIVSKPRGPCLHMPPQFRVHLDASTSDMAFEVRRSTRDS